MFDGVHAPDRPHVPEVYSAGFIGNLSGQPRGRAARKNELCQPVPHPYVAEDYIRCAIQDSENMLAWITEPSVISWINSSRIDLFSPLLDFDDPEVRKQIEAMGDLLQRAIPKMRQLLERTPAPVG